MDEGLEFCGKLSTNGTRRRRLAMQQFILQYVQDALGQEWPGRVTHLSGVNRCLQTL